METAANCTGTCAVVIGRNEGPRLKACLDSLKGAVDRVVYVDSGSTDNSAHIARLDGAEVIDLDMSRPFTAARARNEGVAHLLGRGSPPDYVQFVDGDCVLDPGWIGKATAFLDAHPKVAVASGRRRERFPDVSVYNALCDWEWNTPVGQTKACGGDALMRLAAFTEVGGFDSSMIAGEEPELCVRLRKAGWTIHRLDAEMTMHDADMRRFGQWWTRMRRSGHHWAEGAAMHGAAPERHNVAGLTRALIWGAALPVVILAATLLLHPAFLLLALIYPAQVLRLASRYGGGGKGLTIAFFMVLGKFPEALGALGYGVSKLTGRKLSLIEYKRPENAT